MSCGVTHRAVRLYEHEFFVRGVREPVRRMKIGERWVDVWMPDRTPSGLIIAHDGQNLFDDRAAMHHQTWDAARAAIRAARRLGRTPPAVVGVWNGSSQLAPYRRGFELAPQKVMAAGLAVDQRAEQWFDVANLEGDAYLAEITEQIIPQIDSLDG